MLCDPENVASILQSVLSSAVITYVIGFHLLRIVLT
jgi:hypothetical protein